MENFLLETELLFRIFIAGICGTIVGYERKNRSKEAGLRTHSIVAMGAALVMVISKYGFADMANQDGTRIAAQVVSGVGFLGAGIIFVRNNMVNGLTTAAGIWATSGIGLAIGAGMYYIGVGSSIMIVLVQIIFHINFFSMGKVSKETFVFTMKESIDSIEYIRNRLEDKKIKILSIGMEKNKIKNKENLNENLNEEEKIITVKIDCLLPRKFDKKVLIKDFYESKNIISYKI